jgi:amidase
MRFFTLLFGRAMIEKPMKKQIESVLLSGSLAELRKAILDRELSVAEAANWYINRIETCGAALNAVRSLSPQALDHARQLDDDIAAGRVRGPIHGIPILLKDNISTGDGVPMSAGSLALASFVPKRDATIVQRLRRAGALILGKTNLTEFADYVSDVMPSGFSGVGGMVKNPQTMREYGRGLGSSVGAAAAVAASLGPVAIGSETQNSIQTPASVSSVFGFKPSVGAVSCKGIVPLVPSQDAPGPLGRSIDDLALILGVIAGGDCRDGQTLSVALRLRGPQGYRDPKSVRIGVPRRLIADRPDLEGLMPEFETTLSELSKAGVTIVDPCDLPSAEQLHEVRSSVFRTEFKAALNAFLSENGSPCGIGSLDDLIRFNEQEPSAIPFGQSLLKLANNTEGLSDTTYISDRRRDIALSRHAGIDAALWFSEADVLIAPMGAAAKCTGKAGAPVLAIPSGLNSHGEPFGITVFASFGSDITVLEIGTTIARIVGQRVTPAV